MSRKRLPTRTKPTPLAMTPVEYGGLQRAYDHFNRELFDSSLPDVFITLQRRAHSYGYFAPDRFTGRAGELARHELALNPDGFTGRTDAQICATLVHEQCHVARQMQGTPPSRGYHDKAWVVLMKAAGLQPSSTGQVGGRETGQHVSHYVIRGGVFERAFEKLAASGWRLNLESAHQARPLGPASKVKFTCPRCGANAWGKPALKITCTPCDVAMPAAANEHSGPVSCSTTPPAAAAIA